MRLWVQASQKALRSEKKRERERERDRERERERDRERERKRRKEGCLNSVRTYLPGTVLQGCSCIIGVETYLPALCCRDEAV